MPSDDTAAPTPRQSSILLADSLAQVEAYTVPVHGKASNYPAGWHIAPHLHSKHQLIYAVQGVMSVQTHSGHWVVPPTRGLWMPAGIEHAIRCIGNVHMRSLFVQPDAAPQALVQCETVGISPLLRELIHAAMAIAPPYPANSRDARLMQLLLDELRALPILPLHLPLPSDARALHICAQLQLQPDDTRTLPEWGHELGVDSKTIQRLFMTQTSMTFGRWRQQARLLQALERLACGEKVIEVALALGYESPSAFSTMFRKHFGQAPSQFFT